MFLWTYQAFDCVTHDLLIAKLTAYSVDENLLMYIYSYPSNRKQCVRINNVHSKFQNVISGVPQRSIVGPALFNCFLMISFISSIKLVCIILLMITPYARVNQILTRKCCVIAIAMICSNLASL